MYFNPRSPRGERHITAGNKTATEIFQSTLPARGATLYPRAFQPAKVISIHAPREGSDAVEVLADEATFVISIHAPREGSDVIHCAVAYAPAAISIHAPREGSDRKSRQ